MNTLYRVTFGFIVFCSIGLVFFLFLCKKSTQGPRPLVVGMMSGWAPFMVVNDTGAFEGFDVDVALELGKRLGCPVEICDIGSLAAVLLALEQGKIDIAMSGLDITEARVQKLLMVPYTGTDVTSFYLLFKGAVPDGVQNIQDLQRFGSPEICVEPGSPHEKFIDQFAWVKAKALSKIEDMVLDVQYGKSLAMLVEPQVARRVMRQAKQLASLAIDIPRSFQTFGMGVALTPDNKKLALRVDDALRQMRRDGTLAAYEKKWQLLEVA